jgi:hypothetical protein
MGLKGLIKPAQHRHSDCRRAVCREPKLLRRADRKIADVATGDLHTLHIEEQHLITVDDAHMHPLHDRDGLLVRHILGLSLVRGHPNGEWCLVVLEIDGR